MTVILPAAALRRPSARVLLPVCALMALAGCGSGSTSAAAARNATASTTALSASAVTAAADQAAVNKAAADKAAAAKAAAAQVKAAKAAADQAAAAQAASAKAAAGQAAADQAAAVPLVAEAPAPEARSFANCAALNAAYPHGVGRPGAVDRVSGGKAGVTTFMVDSALYEANSKSDRDGDGIACEKR